MPCLHVERAQDVNREHTSEHVGRVVGDPGDLAADPGVAEQHVDPPIAIHALPDRAADRVLVGHVRLGTESVVVAQLRHRRGELRAVDADQVHVRPFGDEEAGRCEADPALAPGNDGDLVLQPRHLLLPHLEHAHVGGRPKQTDRSAHPLPATGSKSRSQGRHGRAPVGAPRMHPVLRRKPTNSRSVSLPPFRSPDRRLAA